MTKLRVPIFGASNKIAWLDDRANEGATVGTDLKWADGSLVKEADIRNGLATTSATLELTTTDDLQEGQFNFYFTALRAQDAVGGILADSGNVTLTYIGGTSITADLTDLADSGAGTFKLITRDAKGRVSGSQDGTSDDVPEGSTNLYAKTITATAGVDLGSPRVVAVADGSAYYPDLTNADDVQRIVGITDASALTGSTVVIRQMMQLSNVLWSWLPGPIYCAVSNGTLTQTAPTTGAVIEVGKAISATEITINIHRAILRE